MNRDHIRFGARKPGIQGVGLQNGVSASNGDELALALLERQLEPLPPVAARHNFNGLPKSTFLHNFMKPVWGIRIQTKEKFPIRVLLRTERHKHSRGPRSIRARKAQN